MRCQDQLIELEGEEEEPVHQRSAPIVISNSDSEQEKAKDEMSMEGFIGN